MTTEVMVNSENQHNKQHQQATDSNVTTVDIYDPIVKFPLENSWSFWFFKNEKSKESLNKRNVVNHEIDDK
jgi:hypothetical protein